MTVLRRLKEGGLLSRRPARRIKLNRINAQNRLRWAVNHVRYPRGVWDNHMFSDESRFLLERHDGRKDFFVESMRGSFLNVSVKPKLMEEEV